MRWPDELVETPDLQGAYPRLSEAQIQALSACGERRSARREDVLFAEGDPCVAFLVVLAGKVAEVKGYGFDDQVIGIHGACSVPGRSQRAHRPGRLHHGRGGGGR